MFSLSKRHTAFILLWSFLFMWNVFADNWALWELIKNGNIDGSNIAPNSISNIQLKDGSVTSVKILDGSIGSAQADDSIQRRIITSCSGDQVLTFNNGDPTCILPSCFDPKPYGTYPSCTKCAINAGTVVSGPTLNSTSCQYFNTVYACNGTDTTTVSTGTSETRDCAGVCGWSTTDYNGATVGCGTPPPTTCTPGSTKEIGVASCSPPSCATLYTCLIDGSGWDSGKDICGVCPPPPGCSSGQLKDNEWTCCAIKSIGCDGFCNSGKTNDCAGICGWSATDYNGITAGCGTPPPSCTAGSLWYTDVSSCAATVDECSTSWQKNVLDNCTNVQTNVACIYTPTKSKDVCGVCGWDGSLCAAKCGWGVVPACASTCVGGSSTGMEEPIECIDLETRQPCSGGSCSGPSPSYCDLCGGGTSKPTWQPTGNTRDFPIPAYYKCEPNYECGTTKWCSLATIGVTRYCVNSCWIQSWSDSSTTEYEYACLQ